MIKGQLTGTAVGIVAAVVAAIVDGLAHVDVFPAILLVVMAIWLTLLFVKLGAMLRIVVRARRRH